MRADLEAFADGWAVEDLTGGSWPVTGALIVNLGNMLEGMDPVTAAQPVQVQSPVPVGDRASVDEHVGLEEQVVRYAYADPASGAEKQWTPSIDDPFRDGHG